MFAEVERENGFKSGEPHFNTDKLGVIYNVTPKVSVTGFVQVENGDVKSHGLGVGAGYKF